MGHDRGLLWGTSPNAVDDRTDPVERIAAIGLFPIGADDRASPRWPLDGTHHPSVRVTAARRPRRRAQLRARAVGVRRVRGRDDWRGDLRDDGGRGAGRRSPGGSSSQVRAGVARVVQGPEPRGATQETQETQKRLLVSVDFCSKSKSPEFPAVPRKIIRARAIKNRRFLRAKRENRFIKKGAQSPRKTGVLLVRKTPFFALNEPPRNIRAGARTKNSLLREIKSFLY